MMRGLSRGLVVTLIAAAVLFLFARPSGAQDDNEEETTRICTWTLPNVPGNPGLMGQCVRWEEQPAGTIRCNDKLPFGYFTRDAIINNGPGDIPNALGPMDQSIVTDFLHQTGIQKNWIYVQVPENFPEWARRQIEDEDHHECWLATKEYHPECPHGNEGLDPATGEPQQLSEAPASDPDQNMVPDSCWGTFPTSKYDITYDSGNWAEISNKLWGFPTQVLFNLGKWGVQFGLWSTNHALTYDLMELGGTVKDLADVYDAEVVGPLDLKHIAWVAFVGYVAIAAVRGKFSLVGAEFVGVMVMLVIAGALVANPKGYLEGASNTMEGMSNQLMLLSAKVTNIDRDECANRPSLESYYYSGLYENVISDEDYCSRLVMDAMAQRFHEVFVEEPYDYINWGRKLDGNCAELRDRILSMGPHNTNRWVWDYMREGDEAEGIEGCPEAARFSATPNGERLRDAALTGALGAFFGVVLGAIALTVFIAKFMAALLFAVLPLVAAIGIAPGPGRRLFWQWGFAVIQAIVGVIAMSGILSLFVLAISEVAELAESSGMDLFQRWMTLLALMGAGWVARRKLLAGMSSAGAQLSERLSRPVQSGGGFPLAAGAGAGQQPGSSMLMAPRGVADRATGWLTLASVGTTAAIGTASLAARGARTLARVQTAPARGLARFGARRFSDRRRANYILRQNAAEGDVRRYLGQFGWGGGGGGGGDVGPGFYDTVRRMKPAARRRAFGGEVMPPAVRAFLTPRQQQHWEQQFERNRRGLGRYEAKRAYKGGVWNPKSWGQWAVGGFDQTAWRAGDWWRRTMPRPFGGNPARHRPGEYPAHVLFPMRGRHHRRHRNLMAKNMMKNGHLYFEPPASPAVGRATVPRPPSHSAPSHDSTPALPTSPGPTPPGPPPAPPPSGSRGRPGMPFDLEGYEVAPGVAGMPSIPSRPPGYRGSHRPSPKTSGDEGGSRFWRFLKDDRGEGPVVPGAGPRDPHGRDRRGRGNQGRPEEHYVDSSEPLPDRHFFGKPEGRAGSAPAGERAGTRPAGLAGPRPGKSARRRIAPGDEGLPDDDGPVGV